MRAKIDCVIARVVAVSAALVLALTGCEGSSANPETDPSDPPEYAQNSGEAGAQQFAGYWVDTLNKATDSGNTKTLRSLASSECKACQDFAQQLDSIYDAGGRVESEGWEISKIVPEAGATNDAVGLLMTVEVSPQKVYASSDAKAKKFQGGPQAFRLELVRADGDWLVDDLSPR